MTQTNVDENKVLGEKLKLSTKRIIRKPISSSQMQQCKQVITRELNLSEPLRTKLIQQRELQQIEKYKK